MNPNNVEIFVYTDREGMLRAVGHDLKLEVGRFSVDVDDGIEVNIEADSITVAACIVDGREDTVSSMDRRIIEKNLNKDVLKTKKYRYIDFRGSATADGDDQIIAGELEIMGNSHDVSIRMKLKDDKWHGELTIDQREWGMKPFKGLLGTLRIKPDIRIEIFADA